MRHRETYDIGDVVEVFTYPKDPETEEPVEPSNMVCTVNSPDGTVSTPEVEHDAKKGKYTAKVAVDKAGIWRYAFDGTGKFAGSEERDFKVRPQKVKRK